MLQPSLIVGAVVSAWQSIPDLITQMNGNPANIIAHNYAWGAENSLNKAVTDMPAPSILVAYGGFAGAGNNANGTTLWTHTIKAIVKSGNAAAGGSVLSAADLCWLMITRPVNSGPSTIYDSQLLSGDLQPMERLPQATPDLDEMGDFFSLTLTLFERGDVGVSS